MTPAVAVTVTVANTGKVAGDEVTQLYIERKGTTSEAPPLALAAFVRTHIAAGATAEVKLELRPTSLAVRTSHSRC